MIQFVSPDDEHGVLETYRVINRNKYIENNLCTTLVIYQESLIKLFIGCVLICCVYGDIFYLKLNLLYLKIKFF